MRRAIIYMLVFVLWPLGSPAIENRYVFKKLNNENGLSNNTVRDIAQEESGIIWFATKQGISKYDSYNIQNYYKEDNVGIPSNLTTSLLVTGDNRLFIGTDRGLIEYNRQFDNFEPLFFEGKALPSINSILESDSGMILIGTSNGIFAYYPVRDVMAKFVSLQNEIITSIVKYDSGVFIVTSTSGLYFVNSDGILLAYYNKTNTPNLHTQNFTQAYIDSKGNCWIGTYNDGLYSFNKKEKTFSKEPLAEIEQAETKVVRDIEEDLEGNIWICSELGVFIIDPETHQSINIQHSLEKSEYHLGDNATYCLFRSREDIMWIGTYFGGASYTNLSQSNGFYNIYPGDGKNELRGKAVNKLYKDSKGILWIATEDGGVCTFDTKTKNIINYYHSQEENSLSSNNIHAVCEDRDGNIWFGHFMTGIDIYNPTTGKFRNVSIFPDVKYDITRNSVYCIFKDSKERIWAGSRLGVYLYDYDAKKLIPVQQQELGKSFIYNIIEDKSGKIWFCIRNGGIASYQPHYQTLKRYRNLGRVLN